MLYKNLIETIKNKLQSILKQELNLTIGDGDLKLFVPTEFGHGDLTTNISFAIAGKIKRNPIEISEILSKNLSISLEKSDNSEYIEKVLSEKGFINIYFTDKLYFKILEEDINHVSKTPLKIFIESGQPNTHKMPHVGHLYSYIIGDSVGNLLIKAGHTVKKINYQGDIGPHVAKCIYGWRKKGKLIPGNLNDKVKLLQECYQLGNELYENEEDKLNIQDLNKKIYESEESAVEDWRVTRQWSLDFYKEFEERLGINQSVHYLESDIWKKGYDIVMQNKGKIFEESQNAVIFPGEKYGLHNRVFITSKNTPTYEAKEIGLNLKKFEDWTECDLDLITTSNDTNEYFKVVFIALTKLVPELEGKLKNIGFGRVQLKGIKMSSRTGNIIGAVDLLNIVKERVAKIIEEKSDLTTSEKEEISEKVSIGAIKYTFLKSSILSDLIFDIDESISFDGNSGPYLQYTYTRIMSVLKNLDNQSAFDKSKLYEYCNTEEEVNLVKGIVGYTSVIDDAVNDFAPHKIANYLFSLAQLFNTFYTKYSINSAENDDIISARRYLSHQTAYILKDGLALLGIEVLDKM